MGLGSLVSKVLFGVRTLTQNKVAVPDQNYLELDPASFVVTPDLANARNVLSLSGASPNFGAISGTSLTLGNYSATPQPAVPTTDSSTVNLLSTAVPIPAGKGVRIRATLSGNIVSALVFYRVALVLVADYVRPLSGAAGLAWNTADDINQPTYPWCGREAGPITITGASSDGGTQVKLALTNSSDLAVGNTVTVAGAVTSGGLVLNRQWIIDSIPDSTHIVLRGSVWTGALVSGGTVTPNGAIGLSLTSNAVQVVATGITAAPWMASEGVHGGDLRSNANGVYAYTDPGTTSGSGPGPSGTTTGTDGTAPYIYVGPVTPTITWQAFLETWT